jgi:hypothetical protein
MAMHPIFGKHLHLTLSILFLLISVIFPRTPPALAQTDDGYDLSWWTVNGGGGTSSGGGYVLSGDIGQPDAGVLTGGGYALAGGFWRGAAAVERHIYLPLVLRNT